MSSYQFVKSLNSRPKFRRQLRARGSAMRITYLRSKLALFHDQIKFSLINPSVNQSSSSFGGRVNNIT